MNDDSSLRDTLLELVRSKKFLMAVLAAIAWLGGRFGLHLDPSEATELISPILVAIAGQAVADHGKSAAQIEAANPKPGSLAIATTGNVDASPVGQAPVISPIAVAPSSSTTVPTQPLGVVPPRQPGGFIGLDVLLGLAVLMLAAIVCIACSSLGGTAKKIGGDVVDCTKGEVSKAIPELGPVVDVLLAQSTQPSKSVDWNPLRDITKTFTTDIGMCVLADSVARAMHPKPEDPNAPKLSPVEADPTSLRTGFKALAGERGAQGKTFHTAHGDV